MTDLDDKTAVLAAYVEARNAGLDAAECYQAGTKVWRDRHPDHARPYAAKQAVAVILAEFANDLMRIDK